MRDRIALLYVTHHWDRVHARRFERLRRETRGLGDSFVLLQSAPEGQDIAGQQSLPDIVDCLNVFDPASLPARLGYPYLTGKGVVPGCVHFPLQDFARQHAYDHYWLVENDVEFSGDWGKLIGACTQSRADLIAAHVSWHAADPVWIWWRYLTPPLHRPLNPAKLLDTFPGRGRSIPEGRTRYGAPRKDFLPDVDDVGDDGASRGAGGRLTRR